MAARTEYNVVVNQQEYLDRLDHFEGLVSYMLICNLRANGGHSSVVSAWLLERGNNADIETSAARDFRA